MVSDINVNRYLYIFMTLTALLKYMLPFNIKNISPLSIAKILINVLYRTKSVQRINNAQKSILHLKTNWYQNYAVHYSIGLV